MKGLKLIYACMMIVVCTAFVACGDDEGNGNIPSDLYGTYVASEAGRYWYVTLKEDGTGTHTYEANTYTKESSFTYTFSGGKIKCKGMSVYSYNDGKVETEAFDTTMEYKSSSILYNGHTLIKQ